MYGLEAVLTDFGMSRFLDASENYITYITTQKQLPIRWCAPESLKSREYTFKSDVWSYGW